MPQNARLTDRASVSLNAGTVATDGVCGWWGALAMQEFEEEAGPAPRVIDVGEEAE